MEKFSIISKGELLSDLSEAQVLENLSHLFNRPIEQLQWLLVTGTILKSDLNSIQIQRYLLTLQQAGLATESKLQTCSNLFNESLVFDEDEATDEEAVCCYAISLKKLAASLVSTPCSEALTHSGQSVYQLKNYRWWFSPIFVGLATLLAVPQLQNYFLRVGATLSTGIGLTLLGIIILFLLIAFLPPLLSIQRLVSLRSHDDTELLVLKETFSINPLMKHYTITTKQQCFYIKAHRYHKGKVQLYNKHGSLLFYLKEDIQADELLNSIAMDMRQNIAGLGVFDRISHFIHHLFKDHTTDDIEETKEYPDYVLGFYDANKQALGLAYKGSTGVIELMPQQYDTTYTAHLLLLGLVGLGVN